MARGVGYVTNLIHGLVPVGNDDLAALLMNLRPRAPEHQVLADESDVIVCLLPPRGHHGHSALLWRKIGRENRPVHLGSQFKCSLP